MEAKPALRARLLRRREQRSGEELAAAGHAMAAHARGAWSQAAAVAAYLSTGSEPPTRPLLEALTAVGVTVLLPRVQGRELEWAGYEGPSGLATGPYGLLEPTGPALGREALGELAVAVVPAVAVDRAGHRLGRGGGFYDRALAAVRVPIVAVVFDDEVIDELPVEPHDVSVDAVLTPNGGLWTLPLT